MKAFIEQRYYTGKLGITLFDYVGPRRDGRFVTVDPMVFREQKTSMDCAAIDRSAVPTMELDPEELLELHECIGKALTSMGKLAPPPSEAAMATLKNENAWMRSLVEGYAERGAPDVSWWVERAAQAERAIHRFLERAREAEARAEAAERQMAQMTGRETE